MMRKKVTVKMKFEGRGLTEGTEAANMWPDSRGALCAVGLPVAVADMPLRMLCGLDDSRVVCHCGSSLYVLDRSSDSLTLVADLGEGHVCYCGVAGGGRAIVMTSAGAQHIGMQGDEPVCLGAMPGLPEVTVELIEGAVVTETVGSISLADGGAMRGGALAEADAKALGAALDAAWRRVVARASALGCAVVPEGVALVAEVRCLDHLGALMTSDGRRMVGGGESPGEVTFPVTDGVVGPGLLSVKAMRLGVTIDAADGTAAALWAGRQVMAEVAVSAAPEVAVGWRMRVERPASGEARVVAVPVVEAVSPRRDAPLQSVARLVAGESQSVAVALPAKVTDPVGEALVPDGFVARCGAVSGDVVVWGGIEGAPGDVVVAAAASPLGAVARSTVSLAAVVAAVAAPRLGSVALSPGCAHFYLFTADGILNLSVGSRRGSMAASLLDRRGVGRREAVAVMPGRVIAVADGGRELMELRGGRSATLMRLERLRAVAAAYDPRRDCVALLDGAGNMYMLDPERRWMALRALPVAPGHMAEAGGHLYLTSPDALYDGSADDPESDVAVAWSGSLDASPYGALRSVTIGLDASGGFSGEVGIWESGFVPRPGAGRCEPLWRAAVAGAPRSPLAFRLPLPARGSATVAIEGFAAPGSRLVSVRAEVSHCNRPEGYGER